jgi:hypothetical protein
MGYFNLSHFFFVALAIVLVLPSVLVLQQVLAQYWYFVLPVPGQILLAQYFLLALAEPGFLHWEHFVFPLLLEFLV